jgi:lipopolysaccharide export system permease protein
VFDLFTNLDSLLQAGKAAGSIPKVIGMYYFFKSIPIVMMVSSILGLGSAMVTVAVLMRNNELIPIQAAGVPALRIVRPLIIAIIGVAAFFCVLREAVLPHFQTELVMAAKDFAEEKGTLLNVIIDNETNVNILGDKIFRRDQRISKPEFIIPKPTARQTIHLKAENAFYHPAQQGHPAGFLLENVTEKYESVVYEGKPILITPQDADWLKPDQCFITTRVPFDYLASSDAWKKYASLWDLILAAKNKSLDVGNQIHATIHTRLVQPILDISLLFLGLPVLLACGDRNIFKALGVSGLILVLFLVVCSACQFLGANNEMPVLGAWLPLMIFVPMAVNQFVMLKST